MTFNDTSSTLSLLETRRSGRPREMVAPGPDADQLRRILSIAIRTPDHGKLAPWRFVVVDADQRDDLEKLMFRALPESDPDATPAHFEKARELSHQAPCLIVLISSPVQGHKVPVWEQELSVGAVGMNLLHATTAMGFVGGWITGWAAYCPRVEAAFCKPGERIAGFFFLGSPGRDLEERPRPALSEVVSRWDPSSD